MSDSFSVNGNTDSFIKNELCKFVQKHTGQDALSAIDEIVLSYMVSILESLGSADSPQDAFDVDEFAEMMSAYIPAFTNINSTYICEWMFQLADWLKKTTKDNAGKKLSVEEAFFCLTRMVSPVSDNGVLSSSPCSTSSSSHSRSASQSEDEEKTTSHITQVVPEMSQELELLVEMFPHVSIMEVQQCFSMSNGNCEKAVQLILQRQESGQDVGSQLITSGIAKLGAKKENGNILGDKKIRENILNRYAYIDQDDDAREHKPVAPKSEPKKLIRYRDNKIVSIKGERFSEVKSEESEAQKKTCVSLKPSRQCRFH